MQYNDPDPLVWMLLYLYAALLCIIANRGVTFALPYLAGLAVYSGYAFYLFFTDSGVLSWITSHHAESIVNSMQAEKPWIEAAREFFGLLIIICVIVINMAWLRRSNFSLQSGAPPINKTL